MEFAMNKVKKRVDQIEKLIEMLGLPSEFLSFQLLSEELIRNCRINQSIGIPIQLSPNEVSSLGRLIVHFIIETKRTCVVKLEIERNLIGQKLNDADFARMFSLEFIEEATAACIDSKTPLRVGLLLVAVLFRYRYCSFQNEFFQAEPLLILVQFLRTSLDPDSVNSALTKLTDLIEDLSE